MNASIVFGLFGLLFTLDAMADDWVLVNSYVEERPYSAQTGYPAITQRSKYDVYVARESIRKGSTQINAVYVSNSTYLGPMVGVKVPKRSYVVNADFDCQKGAVRTWVAKVFPSHFGNGVMDLNMYKLLNENSSHEWERVTVGDDAYKVLNFLCKG